MLQAGLRESCDSNFLEMLAVMVSVVDCEMRASHCEDKVRSRCPEELQNGRWL
jgi:hypothetical protein